MTNQYITAAYILLNLFIAVILFVKLHRSFISRFYLLCIVLLTIFGISASMLEYTPAGNTRILLERIVILLYAVIPFFSFHFMTNYFGFARILKPFAVVVAIYITGLFSYAIVLMGLIPKPVMANGGLTVNGYIYFLIWMSIFLGTGLAQAVTIFSGFTKEGIKSKVLFSSFTILLLILPGPFSETVFTKLTAGESKIYYITSLISLIIIIYGLFRYKTSINLFDSMKLSLTVMSDIIIKTDSKLKIEAIKGAVENFLEYNEKELNGKLLGDLIVEKEYIEGYYNFAKKEKMHEGYFDAHFISKSGKTRPFNFSLTPIIDNEIITGFISIVRDISERKEMEKILIQNNAELEYKIKERTQELRKLNEELITDIEQRKKIERLLFDQTNELRASNETKDRLFSIIAHDLRNPFTTLMGASAFLSKEFDDIQPGEKKKLISSIHTSSVKIYNLLENLLEWARIQTGRTEFIPELFSVKEAADHTIHLLEEAAAKKQIEIVNNIPDNANVFADKNMINVVLRNLIMNAIKFTNACGKVEIAVANNEDDVKIFVKDNGVGIDAGKISRLFANDDYLITKGTANESGTGLGLRICKDLIEKNGGNISVISVKGEGSNFIVSLPLKKV